MLPVRMQFFVGCANHSDRALPRAPCHDEEKVDRTWSHVARSAIVAHVFLLRLPPFRQLPGPTACVRVDWVPHAVTTLDRLSEALASRYRIERELGAGGMATVYLAHDLRHERDVAIKVLHPDLGAALGGERFLTEIRTTARLQHPHILPLLDSGEADGLLYYVMPLVTGETLRARLERERQLPIADAVRIAREVASALDYAHRQNVIHRDIKPENILLYDGQAIVADFGIALAVQSAGGARMTQTGLSLGTPQYMSPEQAMGERTIDARSDIYALGAVTYEMLAGDAPFTGNSVQAIVAKVLTERPTPLRTLRDTVPPDIDDAVAQALAKLAADRFTSAAAFAERLQLTGATRVAPTASPARRRVVPALLAALAAGAALGAGGMLLTRPSAGETLRSAYATGNAQLTFDGRAGLVAISPGGDVIAFARSRCEQPGASGFMVVSDGEAHTSPCRYTLVVMDSAGTREVTVVEGMEDMLAVRFTSDGSRLVFAASMGPGRSGIFVVPRLGGALRRVGPFGSFDLQRGTDSLLVLPYGVTPAARPMAQVLDLASGRTTDSIPMPSLDVITAIWSPDHRRLVTVSASMLHVLDRMGAVTDSLAGAWSLHLRWTPRGDAVVGFVPAPGLDAAFVGVRIDRDGRVEGSPVALMPRVQTLYRSEFDLAWKTGTLAYIGGDITNQLRTFTLDGREPERTVARSTTFYDEPAIASDGRALYDLRGDALGDNVYRVPLDSARPVEEPLTASRSSGVYSSARVSPDGGRLYFAQRDAGGPRLRYIDLSSGQQMEVPGYGSADLQHPAVPLGPTALVQVLEDGRIVRVRDRDGAPPRDLRAPDSLRVLAVEGNAEGTELGVVAKVGARVLVGTTRVDRFAFRPRTELPGMGRPRRLSWHTGGDLYVARWIPGSDRPTLFRIPPEGGRAIPTGTVPASCKVESISVAYAAPRGACLTADSRGDVRLIRVPGVDP